MYSARSVASLEIELRDGKLPTIRSNGRESTWKSIGTPVSFRTENFNRRATALIVDLGQNATETRETVAK